MQRRLRSAKLTTVHDDAFVCSSITKKENIDETKGKKRKRPANKSRPERKKARTTSKSIQEDHDVSKDDDVRAEKSNQSNSKFGSSRGMNTDDVMKTEPEVQVDVKSVPMKAETKAGTKPLYVGAHVSIAGGLENAVFNAVSIGANCFALFLCSQRQWKKKPLSEETVEAFRTACEKQGFSSDSILPHGSYLLNLGSPDEETLAKSRDSLIDEMSRCQRLGICLYNFHPGSTCGKISVEESVKRIATGINLAHAETEGVTAVIENMCCQGSTVGGKFEELRDIINMVDDKSRVGVCLDTCHAFAAGNDLRTKEGYERMMSEFDETIGLEFLKAIHLNDSVGDVGCHLDRHENIGKGKIGLQAFKYVMNDPRLRGIPMILETPGK